MRNITWKFVTSVHGTATGCPDIDGGALLVYQKPGVYLRLHDLKLLKYPGEKNVYPFVVCFQGIFVEIMLVQ